MLGILVYAQLEIEFVPRHEKRLAKPCNETMVCPHGATPHAIYWGIIVVARCQANARF